MYTIAEWDKDIIVGTVPHEPNDFLYLAFVMGICNMDERNEGFTSTVTADDIEQVLDMEREQICHQLEMISERSEDITSIHEWMTYDPDITDKRVLKQIVTDAEYHDGELYLRYNYSLNNYLLKLKRNHTGRINELVEDSKMVDY